MSLRKAFKVFFSKKYFKRIFYSSPAVGMVRFFPNTFEDYTSETKFVIEPDGVRPQIEEQVQAILKRLRPTRKNVDGGLYVGVTGVAYMFYHLAKNPQLAEHRANYLQRSIEYIKPALEVSAGEKTSFLLGDAGTYALTAVVRHALGDERYMDSISSYKQLFEHYLNPKFLKCGGDEFFVGRTGYLAGALWMSRELNMTILTQAEMFQICDLIVSSGRAYATNNGSPCPLMYHYYNTEYLGAAHGISFILQILLTVPQFINHDISVMKDIQATIDYLLSLQTLEGNWPSCMDELGHSEHKLVHWCHGAPGTIYLMAKAYLVFREDKYYESCVKAGEMIWNKGLLLKGPGICHGIAGNGYAFLLLYRLTGEEKYLYRAKVFADFMNTDRFLSDARVPDNPESLYEGYAGTACFLSDLLVPDKAEFPFQDVFSEYPNDSESRMNLSAYSVLFNILSSTELLLVKDLFKYKALHFGTILHCENTPSNIGLERFFNKHNIRISRSKIDANESSPIQNQDHRVGLILKTSCENWTQVFNLFDSRMFKNSFYSWLIFADDFSSTTERLSAYPIEVDSDVTVILRSEGSFQLYEVYNTGFYTTGRFHIESVGYWSSKLRAKRHRRTDWSGVVLKSAVVVTQSIEGQTFDEYMSRSRLSVDSLHKLKYFTLLKYWREMFNFSFVLQRTNSWGYLVNGSFDGLVGALQRRRADVGGTPVFIRADRARVIDYVTATWPSRPCFIFRHPKHTGGFLSIYTRPLKDEVWCCLVGLLAVASALLCVLMKLRVTRLEGDEADSTLSLAVLSVWSAVCQQGMAVNRQSTSVRLVVFSSFLFALTVYQYYNATVVSTLLRTPPVTIRSLKDLLHSKLKAGVEDVLYNKDYFRRTTDPIARELYSKKITAPHPRFYAPEQGMALVKRGGFAFHADPAFAYSIIKRTFTERETCELQEVSLFPPQNMFAVMMKGSPYRNYLSYSIRKMSEAGLMHRLKSVWDAAKPPCVRTPDSSTFTVSLREFSTPLLLLVGGTMAATWIFVAELAVHKLRRQRIQFRI